MNRHFFQAPASLVQSIALLLLVSVSLPVVAQEHLAPVSKIELEEGDTLVFLGDSITHQCLYTQYVEDYFYTRFPSKRIQFHNAGVGGAQAWDALARFDRDVGDYKPKYVTVLLGMNDGRYRPFDQAIFDTYQKDMNEVVEKIKGAGATPILMTPTMYDARAARLRGKKNMDSMKYYNSVLAYYGTWLREEAVRNGYGFVDMYSPLNNLTLAQRKTDPSFTMIADAVHPVDAGQIVMAFSIISDMGLSRPLSNIRIIEDAQGNPKPVTTGGELTNLTVTDTKIEFDWTAKGLPWVLPESAKVGVDLLHLGHKASREALEIQTLKPGAYSLTIDGTKVGQYQASALSRHIELQGNNKTPQYQQALQVATLNQQRNAGPVRAKRGEWSKFQRFARTRRSAEQSPDNAELAKNLAAGQATIEGMEDRVVAAEKAALEIENEIFKINQPKTRHYVIERVTPKKKKAK